MRFSLAVTIAATLASLFLSGPSVAEPANPPTRRRVKLYLDGKIINGSRFKIETASRSS
jgi:hypothetical protein